MPTQKWFIIICNLFYKCVILLYRFKERLEKSVSKCQHIRKVATDDLTDYCDALTRNQVHLWVKPHQTIHWRLRIAN